MKKVPLIGNVLIIGLTVFNVALIFISFQSSVVSYGLLEAFDADGSYLVSKVMRNIEEQNFSPQGFFNYGYTYHSLGIGLAQMLGFFGFQVNDFTSVTNILLVVNLFAYCGSILVLFKILGIFEVSPLIKVVCLIFFMHIQIILDYAATIHPDLLLTFFALLSIYFLLLYSTTPANRVLSLMLCAFFLGVSFGVKYATLMYAPVIAIYVTFICFRTQKKWFLELTKLGLICIVCFIAGWLIFNPYVVLDWPAFYKGFTAELDHAAYGSNIGIGDPSDKNPLLWVPVVLSQLTLAGAVAIALGVGVSLYSSIKGGLKNETQWLALLIFLFPLGYLLLGVRDRPARYLIHLIPFAILAGALGYEHLTRILSDRIKDKSQWIGMAITALASCSVVLIYTWIIRDDPYATLKGFQQRKSSKWVKDGELVASYLANKANVRIFASQYSYIDDGLRPVTSISWLHEGFSIKDNTAIILNAQVPGRWIWKEPGTMFKDGIVKKTSEGDLQHIFEGYEKLVSDDSWIVVYESDITVFLVKRNMLSERIIYSTSKQFIGDAVEVGAANDFHLYYNKGDHSLILEKRNISEQDYVHGYMVETIVEREGKEEKIDDGFSLDSRVLYRFEPHCYFRYPLAMGRIKQVRVAQYYFDQYWRFPWEIRISGDQLDAVGR